MSYMKILVDSGSDLLLEYCKKYDITVIPFSLQIEGRSVLDSERFDSAKYCEYLKVAPQAPKSIQPSPQAFLDYYRRFSDREHIIVITMSSKISGAHQNAVLARELFERENKSCRVHIVDSAGTSFAISMLALHAAQLNQNGLPVSEIVEQLVEDTLHIGTYYLVDDISFFIKADHLSSFKGSLLAKTGVKSIIGVRNGMVYHHSSALGFQKGLRNWRPFSKTMPFPAPTPLFLIPTAFPKPSGWKKLSFAPPLALRSGSARCAERCVLTPGPMPLACFSTGSD